MENSGRRSHLVDRAAAKKGKNRGRRTGPGSKIAMLAALWCMVTGPPQKENYYGNIYYCGSGCILPAYEQQKLPCDDTIGSKKAWIAVSG
jgi:hypothetical protein